MEDEPRSSNSAGNPFLLKEPLPVQVQLAASLGHQPSIEAGLPRLRLRLHWLQWLIGVHRGMPTEVRRVLRGATRSSEYRMPPRLSVTWGADCAERAIHHFEVICPDDHRLRLALERVRAWARGEATSDACLATGNAANDAIGAARSAAQSKSLQPRKGIVLKSPCFDAEAAAYAVREVAQAVPGPWASDANGPRWMPADNAAIHAGHAAHWAAQAASDRPGEFEWQRGHLVDLILKWDPNTWGDL